MLGSGQLFRAEIPARDCVGRCAAARATTNVKAGHQSTEPEQLAPGCRTLGMRARAACAHDGLVQPHHSVQILTAEQRFSAYAAVVVVRFGLGGIQREGDSRARGRCLRRPTGTSLRSASVHGACGTIKSVWSQTVIAEAQLLRTNPDNSGGRDGVQLQRANVQLRLRLPADVP
jgi:hypothetical protein